MNNTYYKSSGAFPLSGLLIMTLIMTISGIILSIPYLFLIKTFPASIIAFLLACIYGISLGFIAKYICGIFKIRSTAAALEGCVLATLIYTYFKWAAYLSDTLSHDGYLQHTFDYAVNPSAMLEGIRLINGADTWGPVSGWLHALVWLGEIAIIAGLSFYMVIEKTSSPFIEYENNWAISTNSDKYKFAYFNVGAEKSNFELNPMLILNNHPLPTFFSYQAPHVFLKVYHSSDYSENYISLSEVTYVERYSRRYRSGKMRQEKRVIKYLYVPHEFYEALNRHFQLSAEGFAGIPANMAAFNNQYGRNPKKDLLKPYTSGRNPNGVYESYNNNQSYPEAHFDYHNDKESNEDLLKPYKNENNSNSEDDAYTDNPSYSMDEINSRYK